MEILILFIPSSMSIRLNFLVAEQGLINEVNSLPHCFNPLSVAEGRKLVRLVLDLREVNRYLVKCNFLYEDLRSLAEVFQKGFWSFYMGLKIRRKCASKLLSSKYLICLF